MFKNFWSYIGKSLSSGVSDKVSATRISSYIILGSILTATTVYLFIDIGNAYFKWKKELAYVIPSEHIIVFGMILTHHLSLLGMNKIAETKQHIKNKLSKLNDEEEEENKIDSEDKSIK